MNYSGLIDTTLQELKSKGMEGDVEEALSLAFETIIQALETSGQVRIRNFGTFETRWMEPRPRRMVQTGRLVNQPGYWAIRFRPSIRLKDRIRRRSIDRSGSNYLGDFV